MQPWDAAHILNALNITSTIRWDVRTLPPTTAASWDGFKIESFGIIIFIGLRQPWFKGTSCFNKLRIQYMIAESVIALGVLQLPLTCRPFFFG